MSFRRPSHQVQYVDPTKKRPPPIPRGSSGGKREVPANIQRAREQIAKEKNLQRAREITEKARSPFGRSAGLSKAQLEDVEKVFQAGVIRDDIEAQRKRDAERQAIHNFQNRSGRISSKEIARRRKQIEDSRNHGQHLARELVATAIAKRRFGAGLPVESGSEEEIRKFLGDKYGSSTQGVMEGFGQQLENLPLPKKAPLSAVVGTTTKPKSKPPPIPKKQKPKPEPEPQPEPEPEIIGE